MAATILQSIVETKRAEVEGAKRARPQAAVEAAAMAVPPARDFFTAVTRDEERVHLIAEIKKASPSAGVIRERFEPVVIAQVYADAGADALSVLTDRPYFQGDLAYIEAVKRAVLLPVLRKDFIIDAYQIDESRAAGADAVLLIAAVLSAEEIEAFRDRADALGMAALIEVHTAGELEAIRHLLDPGRRTLLGINNRDLHAQTTDLGTTERLAAGIHPGVCVVSESGIQTRGDVARVKAAGARAVLIGETFMRADDIGAKVVEVMGPSGA